MWNDLGETLGISWNIAKINPVFYKMIMAKQWEFYKKNGEKKLRILQNDHWKNHVFYETFCGKKSWISRNSHGIRSWISGKYYKCRAVIAENKSGILGNDHWKNFLFHKTIIENNRYLAKWSKGKKNREFGKTIMKKISWISQNVHRKTCKMSVEKYLEFSKTTDKSNR